MAVLEIAIEIGTSHTSIYMSGNGIVLREPTVIAFLGEPKNKKIRAVGHAAYDMLGKTPDKTTIVAPVVDGFIVDFDSCTLLMREFIKKILPPSFFFFPKIKALLGVPTGLTIQERRMYEDVLLSSYVKEVTMLENIILSGVGIDLPISTTYGGLIANIGGGTTEVAALSLSGVISGCGVSIGGSAMDRALVDYIAGKHNLKIGLNSARKIKHEIGTLLENDISEYHVSGVDVMSKATGSAKIRAQEVYNALRPYYSRIADAIENIINMLPPEIAADINKTGVHLAGGGAKITGIGKFLSDILTLNVTVPEDPDYAAILGAGKLLSNKALLEEILAQK